MSTHTALHTRAQGHTRATSISPHLHTWHGPTLARRRDSARTSRCSPSFPGRQRERERERARDTRETARRLLSAPEPRMNPHDSSSRKRVRKRSQLMTAAQKKEEKEKSTCPSSSSSSRRRPHRPPPTCASPSCPCRPSSPSCPSSPSSCPRPHLPRRHPACPRREAPP